MAERCREVPPERISDHAAPRYSRRSHAASAVATVRKLRSSSLVSKFQGLLVHLSYEFLVVVDPQVDDILVALSTCRLEIILQAR
jgi:hypothetical protein